MVCVAFCCRRICNQRVKVPQERTRAHPTQRAGKPRPIQNCARNCAIRDCLFWLLKSSPLYVNPIFSYIVLQGAQPHHETSMAVSFLYTIVALTVSRFSLAAANPAIKTLVVLMMENHSYDHFLGQFKQINPATEGSDPSMCNTYNGTDYCVSHDALFQ